MLRRLLTILTCILAPAASAGIELSEGLTLSGFGSTSATRSNHSVPLFMTRQITDETCYDCDTTFGLQLDYRTGEQFKLSGQVVKRPTDHWSSPELEWLYASWEQNNVTFHAGRQRLPMFLASEYYFVGHAYLWARPPQDVYESLLGFTSYDGLSLDWHYNVSDSHELTLTPFYGFGKRSRIDVGFYAIEIDTDYTAGLAAELAGFNYRLHSAVMNTRYEMTSPRNETSNLTIATLGLDYFWDEWQFIAEIETDRMQTNWNATVAYHMDQLSPYVTYGESHQRRRSNNHIVGVRYFLAPKVSLNAEWQYVTLDDEAYKQGYEGLFVMPPVYQQESQNISLYTLMINFVF